MPRQLSAIQTHRNHLVQRPLLGWAGALVMAAACFSAGAQAPAQVEPSLPYTVQPGDKLIKLSRDLLLRPGDWAEVARFNHKGDPDRITPGERLNIPLRLLRYQGSAARILSVEGDVSAGGKPAAANTEIAEGTRLQVGPDSSAVLGLADGSRVKLLPNTLADLATSRHYAMRDAAGSGSTTWFSGLIRLAQGTLDTLASKTSRKATPLQVETPTSLVGVRGTQFRVAHEDPVSHNSRAEVLDGKVRTDNPAFQTGADLPKGTGAVVRPGVRELLVRPLLPEPQLEDSAEWLQLPNTRWNWTAAPGAAGYRVQVARDAEFDRIVRDLKVSAPEVRLDGLAPGAWHVRVRAIDASGLEGYDAQRPLTLRAPVPVPPPAPPVPWQVQGATLQHAGNNTVLLWAPPVRGNTSATRYQLSITPEGGGMTVQVDSALPQAQIDVLGGKRYTVRLRAIWDSGDSVDSTPGQLEVPDNWGFTVRHLGSALRPL